MRGRGRQRFMGAPDSLTPRRQSVLLVALLTLAYVSLIWFPGAAHAQKSHSAPGTPRYYLSLGDSLAYGFHRSEALASLPPSAFERGYANLLASRLTHGRRSLTLVNYGCPGESTVSFANGGCPWTEAGRALHDPFDGAQLDAALTFLQGHRGRVDLVTVSLWGNDANAFIASCQGDTACIVNGAPAAISRIATNLTTILGKLRRAAPDAQIVLLGAVDTNVGAYELTHPLIQRLNEAMARAARDASTGFADPFPIFNPPGDTGVALCPLTRLCLDGDTHPSDAGYAAYADLIEAQLRPGQP